MFLRHLLNYSRKDVSNPRIVTWDVFTFQFSGNKKVNCCKILFNALRFYFLSKIKHTLSSYF